MIPAPIHREVLEASRPVRVARGPARAALGRFFSAKVADVNANQPEPANQTPASAASPPETAQGNRAHWNSEELLHGLKEVLIQHGNELYRLRLTRQGKLILYK